ncbi:MAG: Fe-S cluster assembly protein SufD [Sphingomonadales bacterium]|jgi:Fe-S cluster assembly protein SufD|nr:Fe-S cluster assembly protein SufD [Sphingomonadales bacterium]MEA3043072.1 Fe-S cluster assembly protein SufD [Sphingomonadales bacterium]MEA3046377.1 Fe-S cluster assembly protein SufD [Sphingomonadales bacterium]
MLLDLPSNRSESWRWSDLSALPALAEARPTGKVPDGLPWLACEHEGARLLFVDGRLDESRSRLGPIEIGAVSVETGHPLGRLAGKRGWALRLGRDHAPAGLVQIVHVSTGAADHLAAEIVLDDDAQASIVESFVGEGWTNRLTGLTLGKSARLMLSRRVMGSVGFVGFTDQASVGEGASLVTAILAAGGRDTRLDGEIALDGAGAYAEASGALLGRARQRHDANLVIRHAMPSGTSRQYWRSVADDNATCSVAARVEVARGAQKTDGEQSLKGLLLARSAVINAKPELEIFADDVKCAHGATVGELDRAALFYLESRGISPDEAQGLLTRAFVADALDRIGEKDVREAFYADAEDWFA